MRIVSLLIMMLLASLCGKGCYAQKTYILTVERMFELADENSKAVKTFDASLDEARQAVKVALNAMLPDISVSLSMSYLGDGRIMDRDFTNGVNVGIPHFGNNFAIKASQLIYGGGVVSNGIAMARLREELAGVDREAAQGRVRLMLLGFYLDLFKQQNELRVYERNIDLANRVIKDTKARNVAGVALRNDVTRYELQLKNLELAKRRVENSVEILNYDLSMILGLPQDARICPDTTILDKVLPDEGLAYWSEMAEGNAHAVRQSALAVEIGECAEKLARAERRPKVSLVAANHLDGPITIEVPTIDKNFNYWYVGVGVSFDLSSLYKAGKSIRRAQYNTMVNRSRYDEALESVLLDVQSDYVRYTEAYDEIVTLEKKVQLANENYSVIANRYANGVCLVTDMLDASNQLLESELQLVNARINVVFNYFKLKKSSGNL